MKTSSVLVTPPSTMSRDSSQSYLDFTKGLRVLGQVTMSTWWEWTYGSAPLFWRWNVPEQIEAARDGMRIFVPSTLPRSHQGVKPPRFASETRKLAASKIDAMVGKSYLEEGLVRTSLHYFAVPKGESDIRVVFDGTSCGFSFSLRLETPPSFCLSSHGWPT